MVVLMYENLQSAVRKLTVRVFTIERYKPQNSVHDTEKGILTRGTRFAKHDRVKTVSSYRLLILAAGIGVAVIIALTFWAAKKRETLTERNPVSVTVALDAVGRWMIKSSMNPL